MALDYLIYDRTQADVDLLINIISKVAESGEDSLSQEEKDVLYSSSNKGDFNESDVTRIKTAILALKLLFYNEGYNISADDINAIPLNYPYFTASDADILLRCIDEIRDKISVFDDTPIVPDTMRNLTFDKMNSIEKILYDVSVVIDNMTAEYICSDEIYCAEV